MIKKRLIVVLLICFSIFLITSCDDIKGATDALPKFSNKMPNIFNGAYVIYSEEEGNKNQIVEGYYFHSTDKTYEYIEVNESKIMGSYKYSYYSFAPTECSGRLTLTNDKGESNTYEFSWTASPIKGPLVLEFNGHQHLFDSNASDFGGDD